MEAITRSKIESALLYSATFAYLLHSASYSKTTVVAFSVASTFFLRPRPKESNLLKNGGYTLCNLADGFLFLKAIDQYSDFKTIEALTLNQRMAIAATAIWALIRTWELIKADAFFTPASSSVEPDSSCKTPFTKRFNFTSNKVRKSIENNLFYSTLFALALSSSQPKIATASLAFGTTFLFRSHDRHSRKLIMDAGMTCTHLIDGYLFFKLSSLSQAPLKHVLTNPWTISAFLWAAGRLYTTYFPIVSQRIHDEEEKLTAKAEQYNTAASDVRGKRETFPFWTYRSFLDHRERKHFQERLKYGLFFALSMQNPYPNLNFVALLSLATTFCLRPTWCRSSSQSTLKRQAFYTVVHLVDAALFWEVAAPLLTINQFKNLSPRSCLATAGIIINWLAASLVLSPPP